MVDQTRQRYAKEEDIKRREVQNFGGRSSRRHSNEQELKFREEPISTLQQFFDGVAAVWQHPDDSWKQALENVKQKLKSDQEQLERDRKSNGEVKQVLDQQQQEHDEKEGQWSSLPGFFYRLL